VLAGYSWSQICNVFWYSTRARTTVKTVAHELLITVTTVLRLLQQTLFRTRK